MVRETLADIEERMKKTCDLFRREMQGIRAGRATPQLLERLTIEYYGVPTPVNQMANISAPEPRLLVIQPWDRGVLQTIEKAIQKSDLGLTPSSDGVVIRLVIPQLTEERRKELVRAVHKQTEDEKVAIRNLRREAIDLFKEMAKEGEIPEDESRRAQEEAQKLTDKYVGELERIAGAKEREILEV